MIARTLSLCLAPFLVILATSLPAQRPLAITNARILTMEGKVIAKGTVLVRQGKIVQVGDKVTLPAGAKVIDAKGGSLMPGLVSAYSRAGLPGSGSGRQRSFRGRGGRQRVQTQTSSGPLSNKAASKVSDQLYARQKIFGQLLACGVTTLAVAPRGGGFPGQGAILNPAGKTAEDLVVDSAAFLVVNPANNSKAKKMLKETFAKAKTELDKRSQPKPAAQTKKPASKPAKPAASKPSEKKPSPGKATDPKPKPAKPSSKPEAKKAPAKAKKKKKKPTDPNIVVLADLLAGQQRALLGVNSATDLLHYLDAVPDLRFPTCILNIAHSPNTGLLTRVSDKIKDLKMPVLMNPSLTMVPYTDHLLNPAAELCQAGVQVGFICGDSKEDVKKLRAKLMLLVRHGMDSQEALAAVTLVPAKILGLDKKLGSIKKNKDADLLLFDGDPLDPSSSLLRVWRKGEEVMEEEL